MKLENLSVSQLFLILAAIILVAPLLLNLPSLDPIFDFSNSGPIGDTIGGVTAPFINAIAAILVFVAFKEQVKANKLIQEQQYFQYIIEQTHRLENDVIKLAQIWDSITIDLDSARRTLNNYDNKIQTSYFIQSSRLNEAIYIATNIQMVVELIERVESNNDFLLKKLQVLYRMLYYHKFSRIKVVFTSLNEMTSSTKYLEQDLVMRIDAINKKLIKEEVNATQSATVV